MLCFLTVFSSSPCSSVALHSDPCVLSPVPLLLNSLPGDLRPLDKLYTQELKYKTTSQELDHALSDVSSLRGRGVLPSVLAVLKSAFSLWCLHSHGQLAASWLDL